MSYHVHFLPEIQHLPPMTSHASKQALYLANLPKTTSKLAFLRGLDEDELTTLRRFLVRTFPKLNMKSLSHPLIRAVNCEKARRHPIVATLASDYKVAAQDRGDAAREQHAIMDEIKRSRRASI